MLVVAAAAVGWAVGNVAYHVTSAGGEIQFGAVGAVAGTLVMVGVLALRGLQLESATVNVPPLGDVTFMVAKDQASIAWKIFFEASRRVVTQPLDSDSGHLREALSSIYAWIQYSAELLREGGGPTETSRRGARSVENLWSEMYNRHIRVFQSYWHKELQEFELTNASGAPESTWSRDAECRYELREMQRAVRPYMLGMAELAGITEPESFIPDLPELPRPETLGETPFSRRSTPGPRTPPEQ
ncbi:hypothetical protein [Streptomyces sp. NPDC002851]